MFPEYLPPPKWHFQKNMYLLDHISWEQARDTCHQNGGHLAEVESTVSILILSIYKKWKWIKTRWSTAHWWRQWRARDGETHQPFSTSTSVWPRKKTTGSGTTLEKLSAAAARGGTLGSQVVMGVALAFLEPQGTLQKVSGTTIRARSTVHLLVQSVRFSQRL